MSATSIQNRIAPPSPVASKTDFNAAEVSNPTEVVKGVDPNKTDFKTLILNSMDNVKKERKAKENGDLSASSETEFLEKLADQTKEKRVPKNDLGKDDFLKLFVTQLQNQDPLNPDDGTEMAAKLAQFNGLEQMMNVNKSLEKMLTQQGSAQNLQLVNYVGREVTIDGGRARVKDGKPTASEFSLDTPAAASTLEVRDGAGLLVAQMDLGGRDAGTHAIKWDGKSSTGRTMPDGVYTYALTARNVDGNDIPVTLTAKARVTGIDVKGEDGSLFTDFGKIKFDQIRSVGRPGFDADGNDILNAPEPKAADATRPGTPLTDDLERMKAEGKLQLGKAPGAPMSAGITVPVPGQAAMGDGGITVPVPGQGPMGAGGITVPVPSQAPTTNGLNNNASKSPSPDAALRAGATAATPSAELSKKAIDQARSDSAKLKNDSIAPKTQPIAGAAAESKPTPAAS